MRKDNLQYCDFCKKLAHTNCFKCGKDVCIEHSKSVRNEDNAGWLGWICNDCLLPKPVSWFRKIFKR